MDTRRGFLEATRESPDDDLHRLAWADWLDDEGDGDRAAFVRAQVRHARLTDGPERDALEDEADDLLARHETKWLAGLDEVALDWHWHRGWVEAVTLFAGRAVECTPVLNTFPIRELRLIGNESTYAALADWEHLSHLESLDLGRHADDRPGPSIPNYRDPAFRVLLSSPYLGAVRSLRLCGHELSGPTMQVLLERGYLKRLEKLNLEGCGSIGDRATRMLTEIEAPRLEELSLADTNVSDFGIRAALAAPRWPALRRLHVSLQALFRRGISQESFRGDLLDAPLLPRVGVLDFSHRMLDRSTLSMLLRCPRLGPLEELRLHDCHLGPDELAMLADWSGLADVRVLELGNNGFGDAGAQILAASPYLRGLRHLGLFNNGIGAEGLSVLVNAPGLERLRTLNLAANYIGLPGLKALAEGRMRLVGLWLTRAMLGPASGVILSESPAFARLRTLHLEANRLSDEGVKFLARGQTLKRLRVLGVNRNGLDTPSLDAFLDTGAFPNLRVLTVNDNAFSESEKGLLRRRIGTGFSG